MYNEVNQLYVHIYPLPLGPPSSSSQPILIAIYVESKKIVQMNLFAGYDRDTEVENGHVDIVQEGAY